MDAGAIGFRLAPRLNAAGRLGRPEAALELLLTEEREPAAAASRAQLEELNRDRQAVEERILREAVEAIESWPEPRRRKRAYVVAGAGWHEGVIGIVASRLVERYGRPVVLIAGTDGDWKGSGRSIPGFDLHDGLAAVRRAPRALGRPRRGGGALDQARERRRPSQKRSPRSATAPSPRTTSVRRRTVDALVHGGDLTLELCDRARAARRRSGSATRT